MLAISLSAHSFDPLKFKYIRDNLLHADSTSRIESKKKQELIYFEAENVYFSLSEPPEFTCNQQNVVKPIFVLKALPGGMRIEVSSQENPYFMVLSITMCLIYKPLLTIQAQKAYNKDNSIISRIFLKV